MGRLLYIAMTSLDGYTVDASGSFDWAFPDEEIHGFVNDLERAVGTHLLGRRMHEVMTYWDTASTDDPDEPEVMRDYARMWQASDKVVYSRTLTSVSSPRTRLSAVFDPERVRELVSASASDVSIGGATLAASALHTGLVDELHWIAFPVVVSGGTRWMPDDVRLDLELIDHRRFAAGVTYSAYRVR